MAGRIQHNPRAEGQVYEQLEGQQNPLQQQPPPTCTTCEKVTCLLTCGLFWGGVIVFYYFALTCPENQYSRHFIHCNETESGSYMAINQLAEQVLFPLNHTKTG